MVSKQLFINKSYLISSGVLIFFLILFFFKPQNLSSEGILVSGLLFLMAFWWLTNTIPLSITALLPLIIIPVFSDINISDVARPYASPIIFLLLGGFVIGLGLQKSNLHRRFAILVLMKIGYQKKSILIGFILVTAFLSMWLSNTATCLLMLPIALSILGKFENDFSFKRYFLLFIAYSSSIGGMATLIGTAPNAIFAGYINENLGIEITFLDWFLFSLPLVLILLSILILMIFFLVKNNNDKNVSPSIFYDEYKKLGKFNLGQKVTLLIITLTIFFWIFKDIINNFLNIKLTDASIALLGACLFFVIPIKKVNFILNRNWHKSIPWNILILFGGGLSLANLVTSSGLASWISSYFYFLNSFNIFFIIFTIAIFISFMTEVTSNTATTLLFLPLLVLFADNNGYDILQLSLPITLAASCAFMMPIATPPNAIVFSTNEFNISFMASRGFILNIIAVTLSSVWIFFFSSIIGK